VGRGEDVVGGPGPVRTIPFLFIQIFANSFEFEIVKDGLMLPKIFQIKYVRIEN
jgi:hypothetical protein